jgi:hypothetical protein
VAYDNGSELQEDISLLQAVNGVPVAVQHEAEAAVKGEPVVEVRVELKWSHLLCYGLTYVRGDVMTV